MSRLPGPITPVGHCIWGLRMLRSPYDTLLRIHNRYGPVSTFGYGPTRYVYALGRDANEAILSTHRDQLEWRETAKALIPVDGDTALVVSDGPDHDRRRRLVQPAFGIRRIHGYAPIIREEAASLTDRLVTAGRVELHREIKDTIRRIAIRTLFGDTLGHRADEIGDALQVAIDYANLPPFLIINRHYPFSPYSKAMRAVSAVDDIVYREVARRRAGAANDDLLDALLSAAEEDDALSDKEIRDQVVSLIAAGYETTAALTTWATWAALAHPQPGAALVAEIDMLAPNAPPDVIDSSAYLDAFVKEVLRLYGPAPMSARYAPRDLDLLGHHIPPRSRIVYSAHVTHRDPTLWTDAPTFDPNRWLSQPAPDPYTYVPFGGGYRKCIGFAMATLETKIILTTTLQRAELTLHSPNPTPTGLATMYPKEGIHVTASPRDDA